MRLALVSLALLLTSPNPLAAQMSYSIGDTLSPRIKVGSCHLADSLFGPAPKGVLKAEAHGTLGPESEFSIVSGAVVYRDELPSAIELFESGAGVDPIPRGVLNIWFHGDILNVERDPSKPFTVIVDDSLKFVLGMPQFPMFQGDAPTVVPFYTVILANGVEALIRGKKARAEFLGKRVEIRHRTLEEIQGAVRVVTCYRAGQELTR